MIPHCNNLQRIRRLLQQVCNKKNHTLRAETSILLQLLQSFVSSLVVTEKTQCGVEVDYDAGRVVCAQGNNRRNTATDATNQVKMASDLLFCTLHVVATDATRESE